MFKFCYPVAQTLIWYFRLPMSVFATVTWNTLSENQLLTRTFVLKLFHFSIAIANNRSPKYRNSLLTLFTTNWRNLNKIGSDDLNYTKFGAFRQKPVYHVNHLWRIVCAIFKKVSACETINDAKVYIYHKTSIFRYSKKYGSLTRETRLKVAVNMEYVACLLETVRTLKILGSFKFFICSCKSTCKLWEIRPKN